MNQAQVISKIDTEVFQNNYNAITGTILNGVLKAMYQNIYSAEVGVGLLPTVGSSTILPTDDLSTVLARIIYGSGAASLASVLAVDNKTGEQTILSNDGNSKAGIYNGEVFLEYSPPGFGVLFNGLRASTSKTHLYFMDGFMQEGEFLINAVNSKIKHTTQNIIEAPLNTVNGEFYVDNGVGKADIFAAATTAYISSDQGVNTVIESNFAYNSIRHNTKNSFDSPINEFSNGGAYFVSGIGIDTTATGGTDVLNIGVTNANVINYGNASTVHNFLGTAIYELQVNSYVTDKLITLNSGGSIASGIGVGFEIEENGSITGHFKTNATREGFSMIVPAINHSVELQLSQLTADRSYNLPDISGTLAVESYVDSKVDDSINNGIINIAPSQNAVYDALLMKADKQNGLVSGGAITVGTYGGTGTDNDIRVAAATWYISPSNYSTGGNTDFLDITLAAAGLQRYVGFYGDSTANISMVDGAESEYAVYPATPVGKALIGYVLVTDSAAASTPDLSGYMLISSKATAADIIAGTDNSKYVTSSVMQGIVAKYQNLATASSTSLTTNVDGYRDTFHSITALASAMTINTPTGTPTNGTKLWYRIKDNGTARTLTWNASFVNRGAVLPTTTIISKVLNVGLSYNSATSTWDCVAVINEA